jgi:thiol-disulfide isomerase/thioredoxin
MWRRRTLLLAAGAAAAAAGAGLYLWRPPGAAERLPPNFWAQHFAMPGGGTLELATLRGRPLLINFWATWCAPCVREMPELDRFAKEFASNGWQVLGIAIDQENPVREFLNRRPVGYPIALAGFEGIQLARALGNESGALPFTLAFDGDGRVLHRRLGETRLEELRRWARDVSAGSR